MKAGPDGRLYMLAFDQRNSFKKGLFGIDGMPSAAQIAKIADCKLAIFEGLQLAVSDGVRLSSAGLLVDEEFGAEVARAAKAGGYTLAMAVEESGRADFDFEYGPALPTTITASDPGSSNAPVHNTPAGPANRHTAQPAHPHTPAHSTAPVLRPSPGCRGRRC